MTQPPYDSGGVPPYDTGATQPFGTGGPQTPPGFAPAQTPWAGQPLAAGRPPSKKKFALVMAFFATLFLVSVVGFVVTAKDDVERITDSFGTQLNPPHRASAAPRTEEPGSEKPGSEEPADDGPVPKPVTYQGSGSKVLKIRRPERGDALVYVKGRPAGFLFTVFGIAADGTRTGFVITATEAYEGVRLLDVTSRLRTTQLEIEASGPWTVQVRSVRSAKAFDSSISGRGDAVLRYTGERGTATIRGGVPMKPFLVMAREGDFPRLLVTSVGRFDGQKAWPRGPALVEVQATGAWSIRVR